MRNEIIDLLIASGELLSTKIKIPGANPRTLSSHLVRMTQAGLLRRRLLETPRGQMWAYSAIVSDGPYLRGEPDYVYFLRTLGRDHESETSAIDC
jgi:hypothetical protein